MQQERQASRSKKVIQQNGLALQERQESHPRTLIQQGTMLGHLAMTLDGLGQQGTKPQNSIQAHSGKQSKSAHLLSGKS